MAEDLSGLSTTAYAVLSLLALRPWTTYELAKQMQRSLHWFWPRAESKLYEEPKKLQVLGMARAERHFTGRRASTVYRITPAGRRALTAWVRAGGAAAPALEFEALLRVFAADRAGADDLRRTLDAVRAQMEAWETFGDAIGHELGTGGGPFPDRAHVNALVHRFISLYVDAVHRWALWALDEVDGWSDTALDDAKLVAARRTLLTPIAQSGEALARQPPRNRARRHRRGSGSGSGSGRRG